MATLSTAAKNAALDAIKTLLETGASLPSPLLILADTTGPALADLFGTLAAPSGGSMTMTMGTASCGAGHMAIFSLVSKGVASVMNGTVGTIGSGSDIELTAVDSNSGQVLSVPTATFSIG